MSGFEHYERELASLDHEIRHYAAACGISLENRSEIERCLADQHEDWPSDKARETLQGLLILRIRLEAEMLEAGFKAPPLTPW